MATLIKADGTQTVVHPQAGIGKKFTLKEMQTFVDGYVQYIYLESGKIAVVNEEGRIIGLKPNARASLVTGYNLVGDVLLCDNGEID